MFTLRILGGASLEGPEGPIGGVAAQRQRLALLALLALAPRGRLSRDKVLAYLWPESTGARAGHALSNAVYALKKVLGEEAIVSHGADLALGGDAISVDALAFQAALDDDRLVEAAALYVGPLMDGVYLKDAPEFEKWLDRERSRLAQSHAGILEELARRATAGARHREAVDWWRRLAAVDPLSARVTMELMRALEAAGDRAGALRQARIHGLLMEEEFGARAEPDVEALAEKLRASPASTPPVPREDGKDEQQPSAPGRPGPLDDAEPRAHPPVTKDAPGRMLKERGRDDSVLQRFAGQRVVRWSVAYMAAAWFALQLMDVLTDPWGLSLGLQRDVSVLLLAGLPMVALLAWHRSRGRSPAEGPLVWTVAGLLAVVATLMTLTGHRAVGEVGGERAVPDFVATSLVRDRPSVAVLPFDNLSGDPTQAYLADGIHEDVITQLSKVSGLIVISRTSVMQYRDRGASASEIARELSVSALLEGSVQRAGDRIRITAQLIDGASDTHLWAENFDRTLSVEGLFEVQSEIALRIAGALRATLTAVEQARIARPPTESLRAYDLYLQGRRAVARYRAEDNDEAIRLYREALELDPEFAPAWAGLGSAWAQGLLLFGLEPAWGDSAMAVSRRAISLDPESTEGYRALGLVHMARGAYAPGLEAYSRVLELDPNHAVGAGNVGVIHMRFGALDEALFWTERALSVAPNMLIVRANLAWNHLSLGYWALAERWAREVLTHDAHFAHAHQALALIAALRGDAGTARILADRVVESDPSSPMRRQFAAEIALLTGDHERLESRSRESLGMTLGGSLPPFHFPETTLGFALLAEGDRTRAEARLRGAYASAVALTDAGADDPRLAWERGCIHAALGEVDEALTWLEQGYAEGWRWVDVVERDPMLDALRGSPRFAALLTGMRADVDRMRRKVAERAADAGRR